MKKLPQRIVTLSAVCAAFLIQGASAQTHLAKLTAPDGALGDNLGDALAVDGAVAVVGKQFDDEAGENAGAAYVYLLDGNQWILQTKLMPYDRAPSDKFGCSVDVCGDLIAVGAQEEDDAGVNAGAVYVFKRNGDAWIQQQKIVAEDGSPDALFGRKLAVSGDRIIVATAGVDYTLDYAGSAYIFAYDGESWEQEARLAVDDGDAADLCEMSVDIDGAAAIIGAPYDDVAERHSGSVYVFRRDGSNWTQQQKLAPADGARLDLFGFDAALSGDLLLVGACGVAENAGAAYAYQFDGAQWTQQAKFEGVGRFGWSVDLQGYNAVVGAPEVKIGSYNHECGAVQYCRYDGLAWHVAEPVNTIDYAKWDNFGANVALSGNYIFAGAPRDDDEGSNSGAAYVFEIHDCLGDLTGDETVNIDDLAVLLAYYNTSVGAEYEYGDLDDDGDVDLGDLAFLLGLYGNNCE